MIATHISIIELQNFIEMEMITLYRETNNKQIKEFMQIITLLTVGP